ALTRRDRGRTRSDFRARCDALAARHGLRHSPKAESVGKVTLRPCRATGTVPCHGAHCGPHDSPGLAPTVQGEPTHPALSLRVSVFGARKLKTPGPACPHPEGFAFDGVKSKTARPWLDLPFSFYCNVSLRPEPAVRVALIMPKWCAYHATIAKWWYPAYSPI